MSAAPEQMFVPDLKQAERFLALLSDDEAFTFQTFDDSKQKRKLLARIMHGTLDDHRDTLLRLNAEGAGVFVTVNETNLKGREAGDIVEVRAVFADLDGAPIEPVCACTLQAHLIVESSPGKWHAHWLVHGLALKQFEAVQRAIAARFNSDAAVNDLPRVMRLPGFFHKKGEPFMTHIIQENATQPYSAEQILAEFPPTSGPEDNRLPESTASQRVRDGAVPEGQRHNDLKSWLVSKRKQGLDGEELAYLVERKAPELWADAQREGMREAVDLLKWVERKISPEPDAGEFGQLTRIVLDRFSVVWKLEVRGKVVQLETPQLDTYRSLRRAVMEQLGEVLPNLAPIRWNAILAELMAAKVTEVEEDDLTTAGLTWTHTLGFLTNHAEARDKDELLLGRPWTDTEKGRTFFVSADLMRSLRQRHNFIEPKAVCMLLRDHGGRATTMKLKGKTVRVWWLPKELVDEARQKEDFGPVSMAGGDF
jgi:hypothetical protein